MSVSLKRRVGYGFAFLVGAAALVVGVINRMTNEKTPVTLSAITMTDFSHRVGIQFQHSDGGTGQRYIVESVAAGLALFDYDGDGLIDIYFLNGAAVKSQSPTNQPRNALYRNLGNWQFVDVTEQAGVGDTGYGLGVTIGDYNNDGAPDIYISNFGSNVLYCNNGDGTFSDVTELAGIGGGMTWEQALFFLTSTMTEHWIFM